MTTNGGLPSRPISRNRKPRRTGANMTDNARQTIPCPYLDEDGRPCQGRIVCVHSPSGSMLWSLREDGQVELLIGLPAEEARYRLICSCGHGRRKAQPHFVELPEQ